MEKLKDKFLTEYKVSTKIGTDSQTGGGEWKGHVFSGGDKKNLQTLVKHFKSVGILPLVIVTVIT